VRFTRNSRSTISRQRGIKMAKKATASKKTTTSKKATPAKAVATECTNCLCKQQGIPDCGCVCCS